MFKEDVEQFLNQKVKLVMSNGFILKGKIISVSNDSLTFKTDTNKSIIKFYVVKQITGV